MHTLQQIQEKIALAFKNENYISEPIGLYEPIEYVMQQGGKRIRPVLALLSCSMFGGDIDKALYPAMGMEIFHNFTLLHDDIMDNSPLRRGKQTVHEKWDLNTAILSGDTMLSIAYRYFLKSNSDNLLEMLSFFTQTSIEIYEGQQYDVDFETKPNVSIDEYVEMIRLKTAVLLACSLAIGALTANASKENITHVYNFGIAIGLAFQLQDDLLDVYGNTEVFGKMTGTDITGNKKTFLYLKALEKANTSQKETLEHYFSHKEFNPLEKVEVVKAIYNQLDIKNETIYQINEYYNLAMSHLNAISVNDLHKKEIKCWAENLLGREY